MRRPVYVFVIAALAAISIYFAWSRFGSTPGGTIAALDGAASHAANGGNGASDRAGELTTTVVATTTPAPAVDGAPRFLAFGDAANSLGHGMTADGRPIAPSSFLADDDGIVVLDQEKSRILRADGSSIPLPGKRADDLARGKDGSLAVLDREDAKDVAVLDPSGHVRGRLPLAGTGIDSPKDVSRVIVSGDDVFVERNGGGPLLRIGGIDGVPAKDRTEIDGIPTRDGGFLVSAGITNEDEGRAWVTLADRKAVHVWTRELHFPAELSAVAFLDSDSNGTIWTVLLAGSTPADYLNWAVCLDRTTGQVKKSLTLTVETPAWESFRDYAVQNDGSLVAATRTASGVSFATYPCR